MAAQQPGAGEQISSRDSTQGPMSLSEETAGGSSAASAESVESFGGGPPDEPPVSRVTEASVHRTASRQAGTDPRRQASPAAGFGSRAAGGAAKAFGLLRRRMPSLDWPVVLRMAAVAAAVAVVLSLGIGMLCGWLGIVAPGLSALVGSLAFAAIFGVQAWAARSARRGGD